MSLLSIACALLVTALAGAAPPFAWAIDDPRHDDHGPGSYVYPSGPLYRPGQFDLRRFEARVVGDRVRFEVRLDAPIEPPGGRRAHPLGSKLQNRIYLENIDIYIDRQPGAGFTEALPGRNVRFEASAGWDVAVVLTPLPYELRSALSGFHPRDQVIVPPDVRSDGARVWVEVPIVDLGGVPDASWGFQVLVTGARWDLSFDVFNRLTGDYAPNAFTLNVTTVPETEAFGGGDLGMYHPRVIDLLAPPDSTQRAILSRWDAAAKRTAVVPMVYVDPRAHAGAEEKALAAAPARSLDLTPRALAPRPPVVTATTAFIVAPIRSVEGDLVVLEKPARPVKRLQLGVVLDRAGQIIGRVVMTADYPNFLLATAIEGVPELARGATVRFDAPKEK
ncbi:MAG: hypothetical protein IT384_06475 [Deltaproteobacteria bacterium]|nr:hypothetical protein [Deltaproteobacteria bacterium]